MKNRSPTQWTLAIGGIAVGAALYFCGPPSRWADKWLASEAAAETADTWYLAHLGADLCVPLTQIGPDIHRLASGTGPMATPDQLSQQLALHGVFATRSEHRPIGTARLIELHDPRTSDDDTMFLFNNHTMCEGMVHAHDD